MKRISYRLLLPAACAGLLFSMAAKAAEPSAQALDAWGSQIRRLAVPALGCYSATYPDLVWKPVGCVAAPARPYLPRTLGGSGGRTVGNGKDFAAETKTLTTAVTGAFPSVTGLKTETGYGGAKNDYSLQLNSGFMTPRAATAARPAAAKPGSNSFTRPASRPSSCNTG